MTKRTVSAHPICFFFKKKKKHKSTCINVIGHLEFTCWSTTGNCCPSESAIIKGNVNLKFTPESSNISTHKKTHPENTGEKQQKISVSMNFMTREKHNNQSGQNIWSHLSMLISRVTELVTDNVRTHFPPPSSPRFLANQTSIETERSMTKSSHINGFDS